MWSKAIVRAPAACPGAGGVDRRGSRGGSRAATSKLRGMASARKRAPARKKSKTATRATVGRGPARRSAGSRARGRRRGRGGWGGGGLALPHGLPRLPELNQRQRDVIGLALVAVGVFMAFVLWGGWDGGRAGHGLAVALGWSVGRARGLAPVALGGGGGALLLRPVWPALRPLRTGAICLSGSIVLALAAGTLGVSPGAGDISSKGASWT